jgi:hypothetical protein
VIVHILTVLGTDQKHQLNINKCINNCNRVSRSFTYLLTYLPLKRLSWLNKSIAVSTTKATEVSLQISIKKDINIFPNPSLQLLLHTYCYTSTTYQCCLTNLINYKTKTEQIDKLFHSLILYYYPTNSILYTCILLLFFIIFPSLYLKIQISTNLNLIISKRSISSYELLRRQFLMFQFI